MFKRDSGMTLIVYDNLNLAMYVNGQFVTIQLPRQAMIGVIHFIGAYFGSDNGFYNVWL